MKTFSIYELERLSGIRMSTIRIWEKRYGFIKPQRNNGNTRLYMLDEVQLFLNVAFLNKKGYKISKIGCLESWEISEMVTTFAEEESKQWVTVNRLFYYMFKMDIESFEEELDFAIFSWGLDTAIEKIIIPFLEKVDILSYKDSSSEVHFIVTALRKKLILGIEKANTGKLVDQSVLLFLPKGEHYDLVLLYLTYVLKVKGFKVFYLGTNISNENLYQVVNNKKPHFLLTYFTPIYSTRKHELLQFLQKQLPHVPLFVAKSDNVRTEHKTANLRELHFKEAMQQFNAQVV